MIGPVLGSAVFEAPMTPSSGGAVPMEERPTVALVPNVELAFRLTPRQEITLGGFGYVAWRGTF
ncbi:hypothetical protein D3C87_2154690 [compost metagenome]